MSENLQEQKLSRATLSEGVDAEALKERIWVLEQLVDNLERTRNEALETIDRMNIEGLRNFKIHVPSQSLSGKAELTDQRVDVPEGYALVPIVPTEEMVKAAKNNNHGALMFTQGFEGLAIASDYQAMIETAIQQARTKPNE